MMHRFAVWGVFDVNVPAHVTAPPGTSAWAQEYMRWAVHNRFIGTENPRNPASRAETARFLHQFDLRYGS